jgi:hypothetical protein
MSESVHIARKSSEKDVNTSQEPDLRRAAKSTSGGEINSVDEGHIPDIWSAPEIRPCPRHEVTLAIPY